jgi:hypothetical protein
VDDRTRGLHLGHNLWFRTSTVICASGVVIGLLLLVWEFFDRSDYRRLGK